MCLDERNTRSRGRSGVPLTFLRTRRWRRYRWCACVLILWIDRMGYFAAWAVLPALRRTCSPWYRTPLPLYGSGGRTARSSAATCPTSSLSMPSTLTTVLLSTEILTPLGAWYFTGCEYPTISVTPSLVGSALYPTPWISSVFLKP